MKIMTALFEQCQPHRDLSKQHGSAAAWIGVGLVKSFFMQGAQDVRMEAEPMPLWY
jgi:hypothetical protein